MECYYDIAGLCIKMDTFGSAEARAKKYQCKKKEIVDIEISTAQYLEKGVDINKEWHPELTDDVREYLLTGSIFYLKLLEYDGMMLHSSAVVVDGRAYLFTADPGTGKSTHTTLWLKQFGERAYILNDDKPALRLEDGVWYAYGTPWSGKHDISRNERIPVAGIAVLERGETNLIETYGGIQAIAAIMKQVNRPKKAEKRQKLIKLLDKLITQVPIWRLRCNMDPEAVKVSYEAMSSKKITE